MDIRQLSDTFAVSPQITPDDVAAIKQAGFVTIVCNRPDGEVTPDLQTEAIRRAAEAAGLTFVANPVTNMEMPAETVSAQRAAEDGASGPVIAYCRSGTRSTVAWMLAHAPDTDPDTLLEAARRAGYALDPMRPQLQAVHRD